MNAIKTFYIVMEYIHAVDHNKESYSLGEVFDIGIQICSALKLLHSKGVLHRDVKPANILVYRQLGELHAKLCDFGIVKFSAPGSIDSFDRPTKAGNWAWSCPEQINPHLHSSIDRFADTYSLAKTLYYFSTGRIPEKCRGRPIREEEFTDFPHIPQDFRHLIVKATSDEIEERYLSAESMMSDLEALSKPEKMDKPKRNKLKRTIIISGIVLILFAIIFVFISNLDTEREKLKLERENLKSIADIFQNSLDFDIPIATVVVHIKGDKENKVKNTIEEVIVESKVFTVLTHDSSDIVEFERMFSLRPDVDEDFVIDLVSKIPAEGILLGDIDGWKSSPGKSTITVYFKLIDLETLTVLWSKNIQAYNNSFIGYITGLFDSKNTIENIISAESINFKPEIELTISGTSDLQFTEEQIARLKDTLMRKYIDYMDDLFESRFRISYDEETPLVFRSKLYYTLNSANNLEISMTMGAYKGTELLLKMLTENVRYKRGLIAVSFNDLNDITERISGSIFKEIENNIKSEEELYQQLNSIIFQ